MSDRCVACGEQTVFEAEIGSSICTQCGTLVNPTQHVLASHLEHVDVSGYEYHPTYAKAMPSTVKGRNGWALAGQDKEARDKRNMVSMHQFIKSLSNKLTSTVSAVRAQHIFDQAMEKGQFRWGRKAKLVAGAALAAALRESHKSDSLRDIAYLLEESHLALSRTFTAVTDLLQLKLASTDPAQHLPILEGYLRSLLQGATDVPSLPVQLAGALKPLMTKLTSIRNTAVSLSSFVMRNSGLAGLPMIPTACAIFILALEGEQAASLPLTGSLAQALGKRVGASKAVVMQRYKTIYDAVEECIREVPWLQAHEREGRGAGRSKVAKRVVVARGLKDVMQFQDDIWQKKFQGIEKPVFHIEEENDYDTHDLSGPQSAGGELLMPPHSVASRGDPLSHPQSKPRRSAYEYAIQRASQFLLNPLAQQASGPHAEAARQELLEHLLTADTPALSDAFIRAPTRLQMLAASRGGGMEDQIRDEELFDEGEMETLFRDPREVEALRSTLNWDHEEEASRQEAEPVTSGRKRKRSSSSDEGSPNIDAKRSATTKRINMDVLAKLLDPGTHLEEGSLAERFEDEDEDSSLRQYRVLPDTEEIIEEWRPLSPGLGGSYDEDRYDT